MPDFWRLDSIPVFHRATADEPARWGASTRPMPRWNKLAAERLQARREARIQRERQIIELALAGATYLEIGQRLGISDRMAYDACRRAGVKARRPAASPSPFLDEVRHQKIVDYAKTGVTLQVAGNAFGISRERVRQICERHGFFAQHRLHRRAKVTNPPRMVWSADLLEQVRQWRADGLSTVDIAQRLGIARTTVRSALSRHGFAQRGRSGG